MCKTIDYEAPFPQRVGEAQAFAFLAVNTLATILSVKVEALAELPFMARIAVASLGPGSGAKSLACSDGSFLPPSF